MACPVWLLALSALYNNLKKVGEAEQICLKNTVCIVYMHMYTSKIWV